MINIPVSECTFKFEALPEDMQPDFDESINAIIRHQLDAGNPYAWFVARVTCHWKSFAYSAYLGGCSYTDEEDFMQCEYYTDMVNEAHEGLTNSINETYAILKAVDNA